MQAQERPSSKGASWGLAILFGVLGAALQSSPAGFVIGAAIGILLAQVLYLRNRAASVDQELQELRERLVRLKAAAPDEHAAEPGPAPAASTAVPPALGPAAPQSEASDAAPPSAPVDTGVEEAEIAQQSTQAWERAQAARATTPPPSGVDRAIAEFMAWLKR